MERRRQHRTVPDQRAKFLPHLAGEQGAWQMVNRAAPASAPRWPSSATLTLAAALFSWQPAKWPLATRMPRFTSLLLLASGFRVAIFFFWMRKLRSSSASSALWHAFRSQRGFLAIFPAPSGQEAPGYGPGAGEIMYLKTGTLRGTGHTVPALLFPVVRDLNVK